MRWRKKYGFYLLALALLVLAVEFVARGALFWKYRRGDALVAPSRYLELYYPGIHDLSGQKLNEKEVNILLLGGSVLHPEWGNVERELVQQISAKLERSVRVHNMAFPSHTSKDSRIKYEMLHEQNFDLVILYHGINEVRFNNCPPEIFQADYSHVPYYGIISSLNKPLSHISVLPYVWARSRESFMDGQFVPRDIPQKESWLEYGKDVLTKESLRANYEAIAALAQEKGEELIMPVFCSYVPENYKAELFDEHLLDYGAFRSPIEVWGKPKNVKKGIEVHNEVIREWSEYAVEIKVEENGQNFDDICHFTQKGSAEFVRLLLPEIIKKLEE